MKRLLICLFLFVAMACEKKYESTIPYRVVLLELDLAFQDKDLIPIQAYKLYTKARLEIERTGFGGVLVYHGIGSSGMDAYYAFDASCPVEAQSDVRIVVDENSIYGICPKCGSKYELLNGLGNPVEGPSEYMLQRYQTFLDGTNLKVRN